ncbi:MAG: hypothetical protein ACK43K_04945 [Chitinophagales bacterium]|jgi:hypothetical protein|nr:hypothetical protein [Sphingobacteriales bacterium]
MNEISYYKEFAEKFTSYLASYLGSEFEIYYSINKNLDSMVEDLEHQSNVAIANNDTYIPKLKLDICFAIINKSNDIKMILIEAKYLNQLSLKDYSQLVGYLQVAKNISLGLLLLIQKGHSQNKLSNDFQEIVSLKKLPMDWILNLKSVGEEHHFKTGIISYIPSNGIDWINTKELNGISSFEELIDQIKSQ